MSNGIRIVRIAAQNPTGLKPVDGYNVPATNTIGDFAQRQGIVIKPDAAKEQLAQLEESLVKNKELAQKFKGTRFAKTYENQAKQLEQQIAALKPQEPKVRKFNQSLNERITAQMGNNPQYGGRTVKSNGDYIAQSQKETQELAELNQELNQRLNQSKAQKAQQVKEAWQQYENAPKGDNHTYNEVFRHRAEQKEAQDAIARGFKPSKGNRAVPSTTPVVISSDPHTPVPEKPITTTCHFPHPDPAKTVKTGVAKKPYEKPISRVGFINVDPPEAFGGKPSVKVGGTGVATGIGGVLPQGTTATPTPNVPAVIPKGTTTTPTPVVPVEVIEEGAKKPGFFSRIGNFFKGKKGKAALAIAGIAALIAGAALLFNKCGKKATPAPTPAPTPTPTPAPAPKNKPIHKDAAPKPNYTLNTNYAGMSQYVAAAYGVKEGSAEHKQIMEKMWEANPGLRNKTLYKGDKVYLPTVKLDDKTTKKPDLTKQPGVGKKGKDNLERYEGYKGQEVYGVGAKHDDKANQYHNKDKNKVQKKANEAA